jgi:triphosphoribosyl-dephospho-CoA synthetase
VSQFNECINLSKIASFSSLLEISFRKPGNANPWGDSSISFREAVSSALKIKEAAREICFNVNPFKAIYNYVKLGGKLIGTVMLQFPLIKSLSCCKSIKPFIENTIEEAKYLYSAIKLLNPSHLGKYEGKIPDINEEPKLPLMEVLMESSYMDLVSFELVYNYPLSVECAGRINLSNLEGSAIREYLRLMSVIPDSLIAKKFSMLHAESIRALFRLLNREEIDFPLLKTFDSILKDLSLNPGSIADIIANCIFIKLALNL